MALGSILLILALLVLVAFVVAGPMLQDEQIGPGPDSERSHWIAERERALEALLELDFDQQLGKVPPEVYAEHRQMLVRQGSEALKRLEALTQADNKPSQKTKQGRRAKEHSDTDLEALIAKRKKQP